MERNLRKERIGQVVSNKMQKSITVAVNRKESILCTVSSLERQPSLLRMMRLMIVISAIR